MQKNGFERVDDYSDIQIQSQQQTPILKKESLTIPMPKNSQTQLNAPQEYDDDHPAPLSFNPKNWVRDIKDEITGFNLDLTEKKRILMRAIFGEGLCTFLFLFIVEAVAINNGRQENPESLVLGALATAFCSVALIYSFADVSGAHFNPAVTFACIVSGKVSVRKGLGYIGVQLLASVLATVHLMIVFPRAQDLGFKSIAGAVVIGIAEDSHLVNAFFMEMTLTFILVYVIFATAFDTVITSKEVKVTTDAQGKTTSESSAGNNLTIYTASGNTKAGFAPLSIGLTLGFLCFIGGSVSGGAFNPARVFGPALITGNFSNHWLYWIADFLGAALASWAQSCFAHKAVQSSSAIQTNKS